MLATKKDLKALEERVEKSNRDRVETLRSMILKKTTLHTSDICTCVYGIDWGVGIIPITSKPLEERLCNSIERIEKRQELLMQHLGLKFVEVDAVDKHEEIRKVKESVPETSTRKKTCNKCGEVRPITDFHRNKQNKSGRRGTCKFCISEYMKTYLAQH